MTTPRLPALYWGNQHNGIHTVLTYQAIRAINGLETEQDVTARGHLLNEVQRGTFTFVHGDLYPRYYTLVTGTLAELDAWTRGNDLRSWNGRNYVPFASGTHTDDRYVRTTGEAIEAFGLVCPTA